MARTEGQWQKGIGLITPSENVPILLLNSYLNFGGSLIGASGYGFRDNGGIMEVKNAGGAWTVFGAGGGSGDVVGPASATDNAIARFNATTGKLIKNSSTIISNNGDVTAGDASGNRFLYLESGSTRRAKITQEGANAISPLRISTNGSMQLEIDDAPVMTIADTGPVTFAQTVAVPDDAFASSWNGSANVPTKNAVYDQVILKSSALYVTVGDATTNFPVASYADIGAAVNAAYASLPTDGGTIFIQNGTYSYTTPIVFGTNAKIASLIGSSAAGTILKYTPTSGNAITVNHGDVSGRHRQHEVAHFTMMGTSVFVFVGTTNTRTSVGLFLGGANGSPAVSVHDMTINGFGTQIETGQACYMARFNALSLSGGNGVNGTGTGLQGSLVHINTASNSGERFVFTDCTFSDPCNSAAGNAIYVEASGSASLIFKGCSFDNCQLRVIGSTHTVVESCHIENPTSVTYGEYIPMYFDAYNVGMLVFCFNEVVDSQTDPAKNFDKIVYHGVNLIAHGNHISNYGSQTLTTIFDSGLSTANESEVISATVVEGTGVTNIARNWPYSLARGLSTMVNHRNSWPVGHLVNTNNVNQWKVGSDRTAWETDDLGVVRFPNGVKLITRANTSSYTALIADNTILCSPSADMTVTLPLASTANGTILTIKKLTAAFNVTIDGNGSETIDGATTLVLTTQWSSRTLICNGTSWYVIASV